jgi:hypothetical protein
MSNYPTDIRARKIDIVLVNAFDMVHGPFIKVFYQLIATAVPPVSLVIPLGYPVVLCLILFTPKCTKCREGEWTPLARLLQVSLFSSILRNHSLVLKLNPQFSAFFGK